MLKLRLKAFMTQFPLPDFGSERKANRVNLPAWEMVGAGPLLWQPASWDVDAPSATQRKIAKFLKILNDDDGAWIAREIPAKHGAMQHLIYQENT